MVSPIGVVILRSLLGSPKSLNLRNIFWHGFCLPDKDAPLPYEISSSSTSSSFTELVPDFGFFLISFLCVIGQRLESPLSRRPSKSAPGNLAQLEVIDMHMHIAHIHSALCYGSSGEKRIASLNFPRTFALTFQTTLLTSRVCPLRLILRRLSASSLSTPSLI